MTPRYFEDFTVGEHFTSSGRTVTEADLTLFNMISGDWNPIHADAEFAAGTRFGQRIVHGAFGVALLTGWPSRPCTETRRTAEARCALRCSTRTKAMMNSSSEGPAASVLAAEN